MVLLLAYAAFAAQEAGALSVELLQAMCDESSSTGAPGGQWGPQVVLTILLICVCVYIYI